jgi:hypothetical protein
MASALPDLVAQHQEDTRPAPDAAPEETVDVPSIEEVDNSRAPAEIVQLDNFRKK